MASKKNAKNATGGKDNGKFQTFSLTSPAAMSAQLVGDFTQWTEKPITMQKGPNGVWFARVKLPPGAHHYRFLVDGQWRDDPECTAHAANPYGGQNAVRQVA
jgi:1,4-alpha-glucan branching enzyme